MTEVPLLSRLGSEVTAFYRDLRGAAADTRDVLLQPSTVGLLPRSLVGESGVRSVRQPL